MIRQASLEHENGASALFDPIKPNLMLPETVGVGLSSSVGPIALMNHAPHPNAARIFLNWFLSREAQAAHQKLSFDHKGPVDSLRIDIPKDYLPLTDRRQDGVNYLDLDDAKVSDPNPPLQLIKDTLAELGRQISRRIAPAVAINPTRQVPPDPIRSSAEPGDRSVKREWQIPLPSGCGACASARRAS